MDGTDTLGSCEFVVSQQLTWVPVDGLYQLQQFREICNNSRKAVSENWDISNETTYLIGDFMKIVSLNV